MNNNYYVSILIVDDDSISRFIHKTLINLVDLKTTCYEAANGGEALYLIQKEQIIPDIILLDLDMPLMNGLEFAREFKKIPNAAHAKVVVVSSSQNSDDIFLFKKLGIDSIVSKPLNLPYLELIISQIQMKHYKLVA